MPVNRHQTRSLAVKAAVLAFIVLVLTGVVTAYLYGVHTAIVDLRNGILAAGKRAETKIHAMEQTRDIAVSRSLRIVGKVQKGNETGYVASGWSGTYVIIPARDCHIAAGAPACIYRGRLVTRDSGGKIRR